MGKIVLALCFIFVIPAFAQQQAPDDVQSAAAHKQAFTTVANDLLLNIDQMAQEILTLRKENEKLKADLAKAQPMPTPTPTPAKTQ
jgi:uncharacterized small protein (DUF1192 family)